MAPISDLQSWYEQSSRAGTKYASYILLCAGNGDKLDVEEAMLRSPLHMKITLRQKRLIERIG